MKFGQQRSQTALRGWTGEVSAFTEGTWKTAETLQQKGRRGNSLPYGR